MALTDRSAVASSLLGVPEQDSRPREGLRNGFVHSPRLDHLERRDRTRRIPFSGEMAKRSLAQVMNQRHDFSGDGRIHVNPAERIGETTGPLPIVLDGLGATAERSIANIGGLSQPH